MIDRLVLDALAYVSDTMSWIGIAQASILFVVMTLVGEILARRVGLLADGDGRGSTIAVGAASGTIAVVSVYASIRSGGTSVFVPVLIGIAIALVLARGPWRRPAITGNDLRAFAACCVVIACVAFVYGVTISPSIRNGAQPVEFIDEAFYAVLSDHLRSTGVETVYSPGGLPLSEGLPERSWYHWGELWLTSLVLELPGLDPMRARHTVVLPILILTSCLLVGSMAARAVSARWRREAFILGAFALATLAPIPIVVALHFDAWPRPIGFSVTQYGLAFVVSLLGLESMLAGRRIEGVGRGTLAYIATSSLIASHVLIGAIGAIAIGISGLVAWTYRVPRLDPGWLRDHRSALIGGTIGVAVTLSWGFLSGHGFAGDGVVQGVGSFAEAWWRAVALAVIGGPTLIIGALVMATSGRSVTDRALAAGAVGATLAAALVWGWLLPNFNTFHLFFGAIAVVLTPIAVTGMVRAIMRLRDEKRPRRALLALMVLLGPCAIGIGSTMSRLYEYGPGHYNPIAVEALDAIRELPADAKLAYACGQAEEIAAWDARLISITAHTGKIVVPMCYQADVFGPQLGRAFDLAIENPFFRFAPQRAIYPTFDARPNEAPVRAFLADHGIRYVLTTPDHPNTLVDDVITIFDANDVSVLEVR